MGEKIKPFIEVQVQGGPKVRFDRETLDYDSSVGTGAGNRDFIAQARKMAEKEKELGQ